MINYLKKEKVLSIAWILAILSMFIIHPDFQYIDYIDFKVLALLFCLMLVVKGFQKIGLFNFLIEKMSAYIKDSRRLSQMLIFCCFFLSMLITNDVALLTFVPFAIFSLNLCGQERLTIQVIVLQTIAANLGSMFTPIGNPQNLYLFSVSAMGIQEFFGTLLPLTAVSFGGILAATFLIPKKKICMNIEEKAKVDEKKELFVYSTLFILNLLVVFRVLFWMPVLLITIAMVILVKRTELFKQVDYALLITFIGFFVFVGNIGRMPWFREMIGQMIRGKEIVAATVFSQFLSNVPATLLLSGFTENYKNLLIGVNIGGLGTLIASMASLISYKFYTQSENAKKGKYIFTFTVYNIVGLLLLLIVVFI